MAERVLDIDASLSSDAHPALLERHIDLLDAGLRGTTPRMRGLLRQMAAYHMGWTDAAGGAANEPAGKRIRPAGPARRSEETRPGRFPQPSRLS